MAHITDVLKKPVLTEKTLLLQQTENKYTFDVELTASKPEIKDAVEKMFNTVIPYIEQNLEDNNHKQILVYLNIYKGEYMMQTRRFVVAEKLLLKALSLLKELLLVERTVNINLIAETIGLLDALYRVQNQRTDKENYLWDLLNLFQEDEKNEDYYLSLKEKLEQK